jgi:septum formation topological specificity factor MinE
LVKELKNKHTKTNNKKKEKDITFSLESLKKELSRIVSRVKIKDNTLTIEFDSQESIDVLLRRVM